MDYVRNLIHCGGPASRGITGKGVGVAVLDTGIFPHIDFEDRIAGFYDAVSHRRAPYDDNGHGTHIAAIIGGNGRQSGGKYAGIAPGSHMIAVKVLDSSGNGYASDVLAGLSWIRRQKERLGIRIVNISVGSYAGKYMSEDSALVRGVEAAWDDGLVVVVAAGNHGPANMSVTTPGISRKVITVGCSDDHKKVLVRGNVMVDYSGRGPTESCVVKPEILMPGTDIISCGTRPGTYIRKSGTSMAVPVVSGMIALLLCKYPAMMPNEVKLQLYRSADHSGIDESFKCWGTVDLQRLLSVYQM